MVERTEQTASRTVSHKGLLRKADRNTPVTLLKVIFSDPGEEIRYSLLAPEKDKEGRLLNQGELDNIYVLFPGVKQVEHVTMTLQQALDDRCPECGGITFMPTPLLLEAILPPKK